MKLAESIKLLVCLYLISNVEAGTTAVATSTASTGSSTGSTVSPSSPVPSKRPRVSTANPCRDLVSNCQRAGRYCDHPKLGPTIQRNCAYTCNTGPCVGASNVPCHDSTDACVNWVRNGICNIPMMRPMAEKSCKRSCNFCSQSPQNAVLTSANRLKNKKKKLASKRRAT